MTGPICQVCGTPIPRNPKHGIKHWLARQYCGNSCQQAAATANRVSRIEDMLTDGDRPATIFRAFGVSRKAARDEESKARRQSAARTVALLSKAGIAAEIHYDQTARKYDGRVIVDGDAIVTLLGLQETVS